MSVSKLLDRINQLAAKARTEGLTEDETQERDALRRQYLDAVRRSVDDQLSRVRVVQPDGQSRPLQKKKP